MVPFKYICHVCNCPFNDRNMHYRHHPSCREVSYDSDSDMDEDLPPEPRALSTFIDGQIRSKVAADLQDLRFEHGLDESAVAFVKRTAKSWTMLAAKAATEMLTPLLREDVPSSAVAEALSSIDLFNELQTAKQEMRVARHEGPQIEPRKFILDDETIASFDLGALIARKLQSDPEALAQCEAKSDEWKRGENHEVMPEGELGNFDDACAARFHPHLMRKATGDEADDLRIALDFNADDVEVFLRTLYVSILPSPYPLTPVGLPGR